MNSVSARLFSGLAMLVIAVAGYGSQANAGILFSFSNVPMTDGVRGDPLLTISGTFAVASLNKGAIPSCTAWAPCPSPMSVDFTIKEKNRVVSEFKNPRVFLEDSGYAALLPADYTVDVQNTTWTAIGFMGITIVNDYVTEADFDGGGFPVGYHFEPTDDLGPPVPVIVTNSTSVPEPGSISLLAVALAGGAGWFRRSQGRKAATARLACSR